MSGYAGHSHGRRDVGYLCPILEAWLKDPVPERYRETYEEAMRAIDSRIPHAGGRADTVAHGIPSPADLEDIELIEQALFDRTGIEAHHSRLFRYIQTFRAHLAEARPQ